MRLRIVIDLTSPSLIRGGGGRVQDVEVSVLALIAGTTRAHEWQMRGKVRRQMEATPVSLDFSDSIVHEHAPPTRRVRVKPFMQVERITATCDPKLGSAHVSVPKEEPGAFDIEFTPASNLPLGSLHGVVPLQLICGGDSLPPLQLPISGTVVPDLRVSPTGLYFGFVRPKAKHSELLSIESRTGRPLAVKGVFCSSDAIAVEKANSRHTRADDRSSKHEFTVVVSPLKEGFASSDIRFEVDEGDAEPTLISVPVTWQGKEKW